MKNYLHLEVPPLEINRELQKSFCTSAKKCVKENSCSSCIYASENLIHFKKRFNDLKK